jgi:hypothetical protein
MKLDPDHYEKLARVLLKTRPEEMSCEDWLDHVAEYTDHVLAGRLIPPSLAEVERHMDMCPECTEEFCAILVSLRDEA